GQRGLGRRDGPHAREGQAGGGEVRARSRRIALPAGHRRTGAHPRKQVSMALLGQAALAMWWEIEAPHRADFQHWHSHEHFPERPGIPGCRRATRGRQVDGGPGVMVTYELENHGVLSSQPYLDRLNAPTAWSTRMMPLHKHMVRSQCEVLESRGA